MEDNKLTLNNSQKNILSSLNKSNISIFKIEDKTSIKMTIRDYFNDNKIVIEDMDVFKNLEAGESIIARPVNNQGMNILIDECIKVSDENISVILNNIQQLYKDNNKKFKSDKR